MPPDWKLTILRIAPEAVLRPLLTCDITQGYVDGLNDPAVYRYLAPPPPGGWKADNMQDYIRDNWASESDVLFGIYRSHRLVGTTRLHDIDWNRSRAILGICIFDTSEWGRGLASSTIARVAKFAAEDLKISEIYAGIVPGNVGSCRAFQKAGFAQVESKPNGDLQFRWVKPS